MASSSCNQQENSSGVPRKKKLLVISLGGILCHRVCYKDKIVHPISRLHDAAYGSYKVYRRPYCEDFVRFCLERFEVGVWSSAKEWYLNNALDGVMGNLSSRLLFSWDQSQCLNTGFSSLERKEKPIILKDLNKVWEKNNSNLMWFSGQFSSLNTLLIDDSPYKSILNPPYNAIFPAEYKAHHVGDTLLAPNSELRRFLTGLAEADDVPSYVKINPIGQPAVSPSHPEWDFYSEVVRRVRVA